MGILIDKWKAQQYSRNCDFSYLRGILEKYPKDEVSKLAEEHGKVGYEPISDFDGILGWNELNIKYYQHRSKTELCLESMEKYCQKLKKYPQHKAQMKYHFYQSKICY